jgi:hypothetical protein
MDSMTMEHAAYGVLKTPYAHRAMFGIKDNQVPVRSYVGRQNNERKRGKRVHGLPLSQLLISPSLRAR